jgi:hypothetical protein
MPRPAAPDPDPAGFKPAGVYRRITFSDGSDIDLRRYRK